MRGLVLLVLVVSSPVARLLLTIAMKNRHTIIYYTNIVLGSIGTGLGGGQRGVCNGPPSRGREPVKMHAAMHSLRRLGAGTNPRPQGEHKYTNGWKNEDLLG